MKGREKRILIRQWRKEEKYKKIKRMIKRAFSPKGIPRRRQTGLGKDIVCNSLFSLCPSLFFLTWKKL
jgi:hypothetical protein